MAQGETNRWVSVTLDTLLLHDGLQKVTDLVELPADVQQGNGDQSMEIVSFDSNNPQELAQQLKSFCSRRNLAYGQLLQYRLSSIVGLWRSQRKETKDEICNVRERDSEEDKSVSESIPFTSRVSLLLVFPLLELESSTRPELRVRTSRLLLECLADYPPLALIREPKDCFPELEMLLCNWLDKERDISASREEMETTAACLVALACARGTVRIFVKTIHVLESFVGHMKQLGVRRVLQRLADANSNPSGLLCLLAVNHVVCWTFDDRLKKLKAKSEWERGRSVACDGRFLYATGMKGVGLVKLGTGLHGTIRGYQYCIKNEMDAGWVVWADGHLLYRPAVSSCASLLANLVDTATLKVVGAVNLPENDKLSAGSRTTLCLCSDGQYVFWVWYGSQPVSVSNSNGGKTRVLPVYVQPFRLKSDMQGGLLAEPLCNSVLIRHKDNASFRLHSSSKLSSPFSSRYQAAALSAASLVSAVNTKEDPDATSCGLTTKVLSKAVFFTDGTFLVIVIGQGTGSASSRSLFGGAPLSKGVLTSLCFDLTQGECRGRVELNGTGSNAFSRGSAVDGAGMCYDPVNNAIWTCVHDYIDQWRNTCQLSNHHASKRLGLPELQYQVPMSVNSDDQQLVSVEETRRVLLQHLGIICCNELAADQKSHHGDEKAPMIDSGFLQCTLQLLTNAVDRDDVIGVQCILMVVEVVITSLNFEKQPLTEGFSLYALRESVWKLATDSGHNHIQTEAAHLICSGLHIFYPSADDIHSVVTRVLDLPADSPGSVLRDQLLLKLASQFNSDASASQCIASVMSMPDAIVEHVFRFVIEEAYSITREVQTASVEQLDKLMSLTPQMSPRLTFVSSVVSSLLTQILLCGSDEQKSDEIQTAVCRVLHLGQMVFDGCRQILDTLLEFCDTVISEDSVERKMRLNALERVTKGTALGRLLPLLVCCLNHSSLKCLHLAESLVGHLVRLTVLTSKAALLFKQKAPASLRQDSVEAIAQTGLATKEEVSSQLLDSQEVGYLSSLPIPSPWTAGKTVETIHPVRDNYKFKETVKIPGARNLFLKFDPRCASQYDYDKVVVHGGTTTTSKKVAEYGGNVHGFGSRSVLGSGWPKDPIKVEGDAVTFTFEMRSGREHNTPDRACWGFACTVRAQERLDEGEGTGLPFMADLALGLSVLSCSLIQILYDGPAQSADEESCQDLFTHPLMHRCVWPSSMMTADSVVPDKPLSCEAVKQLRAGSGKVAPSLRPSIEKIVQQENIECLLVSAVLKQLELLADVRDGNNIMVSPIIPYLFTKVDALIRQIASICETEMNWLHDVSDVTRGVLQPVDTFFVHYAELGKVRELQLLCDMVNIEVNPLDWFETVRQLTEELNKQVHTHKQDGDSAVSVDCKLTRTNHIVKTVIEKAELLFHITLSLPVRGTSTSDHLIFSKETEQVPSFARSVSAPSELQNMRAELKEGIHELLKLRQWQTSYKKKKQPHKPVQLSAQMESTGSSPQQQFIDELLSFVSGGVGEIGITGKFMSACTLRRNRGQSRSQALHYMKQLMDVAREVGGATQLVSYITPILSQGPRASELICGGLDDTVHSGFEEALAAVVNLARQQPIACLNSIGLLCVIPYSKAEEACLVGSGLLQLLDVLCSPKAVTGDREVQRKVAAIAWAGFRVLADRCVSWEEKDQNQTTRTESGLAHQVSNLLSNHLARVSHGHSEALHDALAYHHSLSQRSNMGKAIISQPTCIARLLSLLVEQRPTPKLVQVVLQLCCVALPLMSVDDNESVSMPVLHRWSNEAGLSTAAQIVHLLIAKLGDFVMPMFSSSTAISRSATPQCISSSRVEMLPVDEKDEEMDRVSVFVHKRQDQSAHEVIQPLLSSDSRPFRLGGASNMERVMKMDRMMNQTGRAEAMTEDRRLCLKRAARWAQSGFVISIGAPADGVASTTTADDRKKKAVEVCRDRNEELVRGDNMRPFISGHVANSMASDIIAVLHSLLSSKESKTWHVWSNAIREVLLSTLDSVPSLVSSLASHAAMEEITERADEIMISGKSALAALCALGGFKESLRPGCDVQIKDHADQPTRAQILSISDHEGVATVSLHDQTTSYHPKRIMQVPLCRLVPPSSETLPLGQLDVTNQVVKAVESLLTSSLPSSLMIPMQSVDRTPPIEALTCARLLGEMRSRACMLLSQHIVKPSFAKIFMETAHQPLKMLCELANRCSPGERLPVVEQMCEKLRMLYRDCSRPAAPPPMPKPREIKQITFDVNRSFPQPRACILCNNYKDVTFLGDSSPSSTGHPRGLLLFTTSPVEASASGFYWEVELVNLSDGSEDELIHFSMGFMPSVESVEETWNPPEGSCLLHSTGRAHVYGSGVLDRKSFPLNIRTNVGDVLGMGWMRAAGTPSVGVVFITHNGTKLDTEIEGVRANLWPVIHLQKKNGRVRANFGSSPFAFEEGQQLASSSERDPTEDVQSTFRLLPFHSASDTDSDSGVASTSKPVAAAQTTHIPTVRPSSPIATVGYEASASSRYELCRSYNDMVSSGPAIRAGAGQPPEMVFQEDDEKDKSGVGQEDLHGLLVKAWETKVFPVIKRRFRNESERKSGLEQIKGALQLGMADIARQTVEFLYEENGGIPRDLHLPTLVEVKADTEKFTIGRLHKGMSVVIRSLDNSGSLPKFGIVNMIKTFGLIGTVLDLDKSHELVQVETYLESEGALVDYWYPVSALEKPPRGHQHVQKNLTAASMDSLAFHRVLLQSEAKLSRLYCRSALLTLLDCVPPSDVLSDVDQLRLLSCHLLCCPQPDGTAQLNNLNTAPSAEQCLQSITCSPLVTFFATGEKQLTTKLMSITEKASSSKQLSDLASSLCCVLQGAPKSFQLVELKITENSSSMDVYLMGAAAIVLACQSSGKRPSESNGPWARLLIYRGPSEGSQHLQTERFEIMRYPNDSSSMPSSKAISSAVYCGDHFPSCILPCDRLHVVTGAYPNAKACLRFFAVPPDLPIALAFMVTLVDNFDKLSSTAGVEHVAHTLMHCAESLCKLLCRAELAIIIREHIFHVLSSILKLFCFNSSLFPYVANMKVHHQKLTSVVVGELKELVESETDCKSQEKEVDVTLKTSQLSTYCQCLFEVVCALWCVNCKTRKQQDIGTQEGSDVAASSGAAAAPRKMSPRSGKDKITSKGVSGAKKQRTPKKKTPIKKARGGSPSSVSVTELSAKVVKKCEVKPESDSYPEWLERAFGAMAALQCLVHRQQECLSSILKDIVKEASGKASSVAINRRLLVIRGLPETTSADQIATVLSHICSGHGGLRRGELYLPRTTRICEVEEEVAVASNQVQVDDSTEHESESPEEIEVPLSAHVSLVSQVEELATQARNIASTVDDVEHGHLASLQVALSEAHDALSSAMGNSMTRQLVEQALGSVGVDSESDRECDDMQEHFGARSVSALFVEAEALAQELALDTAVERDDLYATLEVDLTDDVDQTDDADHTEEETHRDWVTAASVTGDVSIEETHLSQQHDVTEVDKKEEKSFEKRTEARECCVGVAVLEVRCAAKLPSIIAALMDSSQLTQQGGNKLSVQAVNDSLQCSDAELQAILRQFLLYKLVQEERLTQAAHTAFAALFHSCTGGKKSLGLSKQEAGANTLISRLVSCCQPSEGMKSLFTEQKTMVNEPCFLDWLTKQAVMNPVDVWKALIGCGYDLQLNCVAEKLSDGWECSWHEQMDRALVIHIDELCDRLVTTPSQLEPDEVFLDESDIARPEMEALHGVSHANVAARFAFLCEVNRAVEHLLPLVDMRVANTYHLSVASLLSQAQDLLFYHTKMVFVNHILNMSAHRSPDEAPPEISLDPLEVVGREMSDLASLQFCQAARQLNDIPSSKLHVRLAAGGDPTFSFNVRYSGEEVHGTSGSFRHFLSQVAKELTSQLPILIPCPSSSAGRNKGKLMVKPGAMAYSEEKLLQFFGQLLGVAIRAEVPVPLDLLPCFWKSLLGCPLDREDDLKEADILTYKLLKNLGEVETQEEFSELSASATSLSEELSSNQLVFVYPSVRGEEVELCPNGSTRPVTWNNRLEFVQLVKDLRLTELASKEQITVIRCGMASVIPIQLLHLLTPRDLELRTCGQPEINLAYLKAHTMYQVGLMDTDKHIQYFWRALESFSQDELRRFVKFACNQERIPMGQPCRASSDIHIPPFPMKLAPPDGKGPPDSRFIRAETCMFMIKLPQYSSQQIMSERLLYAINCREDPLSG